MDDALKPHAPDFYTASEFWKLKSPLEFISEGFILFPAENNYF